MKRQLLGLLGVALLTEVATSWLEWHLIDSRDGLQRSYEGSFITYELLRLAPWVLVFSFLAGIGAIIVRLIHKR